MKQMSTLFAVLLAGAQNLRVDACNHFSTVAGDGTAVVGRDMQFALPQSEFPFNLRTHPKGKVFESPRANRTPGAKWTIKYGYLGAEGLHMDACIDGVNTEGLQCSALYFTGFASFQNGTDEQKNITLTQTYLCDWILANHATVAQVNETLPKMIVEGLTIPRLGMVPLHHAVTDKSGEGIVIEYTDGGKLTIFRNFVGVMTNSPTYDWHMTNLGTIAPNMFPVNPEPVNYGGAVFEPFGNWGSMVGLPGNGQAGSRFVRLAVFLHFAQNKNLIPTAEKGVNLMSHLMNIGEMVNGTATPAPTKNANGEWVYKYEGDSSLWSLIYDLVNMNVYLRSYNNFVWQYIDMKALNFTEGATERIYNMYSDMAAPNVTGKFRDLKL